MITVTEVEIETALYKVLKSAPIETVIRCLGEVYHDIEAQCKRERRKNKIDNSGTWAMYGDKLKQLVG